MNASSKVVLSRRLEHRCWSAQLRSNGAEKQYPSPGSTFLYPSLLSCGWLNFSSDSKAEPTPRLHSRHVSISSSKKNPSTESSTEDR